MGGKMGKPWENHGKTMGKMGKLWEKWENYGKKVGKHGEKMGKPWENHWQNHDLSVENPLETAKLVIS